MAQDMKTAPSARSGDGGMNPAGPAFIIIPAAKSKNCEHTPSARCLWGFWSVVIVGAIAYLLLRRRARAECAHRQWRLQARRRLQRRCATSSARI